jgi:hypothetical protein
VQLISRPEHVRGDQVDALGYRGGDEIAAKSAATSQNAVVPNGSTCATASMVTWCAAP